MERLHANVLGEGTPLIILHGFLGMSDNWKTLGKRYADEGFRVHLLDQRNHGRSFWSDAFNYPLMAQDLERYMDRNQLGQAILLGHSMGGKTAMTFATAFQDRVKRLLVADIGPRQYPPHHQHILEALEALPLGQIQSRGEADEKLSEYLPDWGIRQFLLKNLYWQGPRQLGFRFNLDVLKDSMEAIGAALPESAWYDGPTLFIRGGNSDYIGESDREGILAHFPNARIESVPGAGHWLHAEKPDAFFRLSCDFMKS
ncbi:alpha/beta fold hydrolase [Robiginitalea biformata]|uniref:Hydrolase, alpha/beta fold family, putative n=1 Tax=Robiginitalea biformata (strain ATCC BAA-864 / DSM 15991 / KCTC 12146 / HTCC2501) TaxID=313596 RepID=A4CPU6_ROBBH|nr:alpha/beta fold hydrolase [Robiginitalea biformata]EAR14417.1 hydrolase, alpha/beta fold family, putative [Robiginitalea biformata HTCC2501]